MVALMVGVMGLVFRTQQQQIRSQLHHRQQLDAVVDGATTETLLPGDEPAG